MCQLKSCLVLKDRVFCPDYDSHQSMLEELGIKDDYLHANKTFVRVEFIPPAGVRSLMEPLDKWTLNVDQDIMPEWWNEKFDRPRVEKAIEIWRKEHVFVEGEHIVENEEIYALGNAKVRAFRNAMIKAYNNAMVEAWINATVEVYDNVMVTAHNEARVNARGNAIVQACDSVKVKAEGNATVKAYDDVTVIAGDSATVKACGNTTVKAWDSTTVEAYDGTMIRAYDDVKVTAYNYSTVVYPWERKIVYTAGWMPETHKEE